MEALQTLGSGFTPQIKGALRLAAFLGLLSVLVPVHIVYRAINPGDSFRIAQIFHRLLIRLLGIKVRLHGEMAKHGPILFVANHASYLDIPILAAAIPAAFVAKAEVASWPLFGLMAKLQQTVFVERRSSRTRKHAETMHGRLAKGQNLILFPEGTSSDGLGVLPFRSGLFAAAGSKHDETRNALVQPVSIACTQLDGLPITRAWRPYYAWFGDMTLVGHLWNVFKIGRFTVDIVFHPPAEIAAFADRKALAAHCQKLVAEGVQQCLTGRPWPDHKNLAQRTPPAAIPVHASTA